MIKFKVLYVDDETENLTSFKYLLKNDYEIILAISGFEALDILSKEEIHIVVSDQKMPGMTGVEFLEKVTTDYPDTIRILLTAYTEMSTVIAAVNKGHIYQYVTKPFDELEMKFTLNKAIDLFKVRDHNKQLLESLSKTNEELNELNKSLELKVLERTQGIQNFVDAEAKVFQDMIQIFDWKKSMTEKQVDSLAHNLIHQLNIGFLHGAGFGSLLSVVSILLSKAKHQPENKGYLIQEKVIGVLKENYLISTDIVNSLALSQSLIMEKIKYQDEMLISEIPVFLAERISKLEDMLAFKSQTIVMSTIPIGLSSKKIIFNKDKMSYVFEELFINAMKYSLHRDKIYVFFFKTNDELEIKILNRAYANSDGTVGITGKNENRVFEPFFRLSSVVDDQYLQEKFKFGLGLTIVKKILDLHNSDISIYSVDNNMVPPPTKDVCVWIRLKIQKDN